MKVLGIDFAPLNIPLERRLQTLAAFQWTCSFLFLGFGSLFLSVYLLFTRFYWVPLLYAIWYYFDRHIASQGGRRSDWVRRWRVWEYFRDYFPVKLVKTSELDPKKNYIIGYHPHGMMCAGAFCNFATEATGFSKIFPGICPTLMVLIGQFKFPFHREYIMSAGMTECSPESFEWWLSKNGTGNAVVLVVGGALEVLEARPGSYSLNLVRRKGFIKIAMKYGASLVPTFSFGENELFQQMENPEGSFIRKIQNKLTKLFGFAVPVMHGRGIFQYTWGILPYRRPVNTVVGTPIDVDKNENPTPEQIDQLHKTYLESLQQLFEDHKEQFGIDDKSHLQIL